MSEPNAGSQKEWEKFDDVSLHNVKITDEEETPKNDKQKTDINPEEKKENTPIKTQQEMNDPLQKEADSDEEIEVPPPSPQKPSAAHYEPRTLPVAPVPCMPVAPIAKPKPIYLDVCKLEDGVPGIPRASVISDPKNVNGKILATVFPDNIICDWITPPTYDPEEMPSILAIDIPTLTGQDYVLTVNTIVKDYRFRLFATIYSRIIAIWMTLWIALLAGTLLVQSKGGWPVMIWCLIWAVLLFVGIYACAMIRRRIRIGLNHVVEKANKIVVDRHFLTGVEDRGQLSCHKVVIHFIRFNVLECTAELIKQLKIRNSGGCVFGGAAQSEVNDESIEREAAALILEYSQEFVKSVVKKRLIFPSKPIHGVSNYAPKHCKTQMCLCQFIDERKFNAKPRKWYVKYI
ncbi:unnamed protein product [Caenorhabditis brenneri]